MSHVHTLQSDSKIHVLTHFFKMNCQICVIVVFKNVNTVRKKCEYGFFHITNAKKSCQITSRRRVIFGINVKAGKAPKFSDT